MPLPGRLPEGHAVFVAVDGAVLQFDLVHAVSGRGGLCLMRVLCLDLCFYTKILPVLLAATTYGESRIPEVKKLGRSPLQLSRALSNFANGTSDSVVPNALSRMEWIVMWPP